jgi:hypothetical protein
LLGGLGSAFAWSYHSPSLYPSTVLVRLFFPYQPPKKIIIILPRFQVCFSRSFETHRLYV